MADDKDFQQDEQAEITNEQQLGEKMNADEDTPFSAANDVSDRASEQDPNLRITDQSFSDTHQVTDIGVDSDELYQEGLRQASGSGKANVGESTDVPPTPGLPHIADTDHS